MSVCNHVLHRVLLFVCTITVLVSPTVAFAGAYGAGSYGASNYGAGDTTAPTLSGVSTIATPSTDTTPTVSLTSDEAGTLLSAGSCTPSSTSIIIGVNSITFTALADGTYTNCQLSVIDAAGNDSATTTLASFTIDTTGPAASLSGLLNDNHNASRSDPLSWTAADASSGIASYQVYLDGALLTTTTGISTPLPSSLACNDQHSWYVRATDNTGNTTDSSTQRFSVPCGSISFAVSSASFPPISGTTPTPTANPSGLSETQIQSILSVLNSFGVDKAVLAGVTAALRGSPTASTPVSPVSSGSFTRDLQLHQTGTDVKALQKYLNREGFTVVVTGPGSPGHETSTFGAATYRALVKYQKARNITPASGYLGPKTRAAMNSGS